MDELKEKELVLVVRQSCFGLRTGCPSRLSVYLYTRFANLSFDTEFDAANPDSDEIPYVEHGDYVEFNNENSGVIETLKEDGIVDFDMKLSSDTFAEWLSTKAMVSIWLSDAMFYELWVASDGNAAKQIYFVDLPWSIGKILCWKQTRAVKQLLGITSDNAKEREAAVYRKASLAYEAIAMKLEDQHFWFSENRPTSLDALFLGHASIVLQGLAATSLLRRKILMHEALVKYTEIHKRQFLEASSSSYSVPRSPHDPSTSSTPSWGAFYTW